MGLKSLPGLESPFSYQSAVRKYGLEQLAKVVAIIVRAKFSQNPIIRANQVRQFIREEADAMHRAGGYATKFALTLLDDENSYIGALDEEAAYPVD